MVTEGKVVMLVIAFFTWGALIGWFLAIWYAVKNGGKQDGLRFCGDRYVVLKRDKEVTANATVALEETHVSHQQAYQDLTGRMWPEGVKSGTTSE